MLKKIVLLFAALALAKAQIPLWGFCPEYLPMANFDQMKFLGIWHEAERYFQLSEIVSRCVTANYSIGHDQKLRVSNEVTNRFTGIKRVLEGEIKPPASKSEVGILTVKYNTVPLTPETKYSVLETDYDNYAILWSCNGFGPVHAQNAWLMTRERYPAPEVLQEAYGVLDKYKIDKRYIVKTDQKDCDPGELPRPGLELVKPQVAPAAQNQEPAVAPEKKPVQTALRSASVSEAEAADVEAHQEGVEVPVAAEEPLPVVRVASLEKVESASVAEAKPEAAIEEAKPEEVAPKATAPETVPERILKVAEAAKKDEASEPEAETNTVAEESKNVEVAVPVAPETEAQPISVAEFAAKTPLVPEPALPVAESESPAVEHKAVEESKPIEQSVRLAEIPEPVEVVPAAESVEEAKPLEAVPAVKSPEPAAESSEKIEAPAAVEPLPESSQPSKLEAPVEPPAVLLAEPEKIADVPEPVKLTKPALEQPLKSIEVAAEEPKLEPTAEVKH